MQPSAMVSSFRRWLESQLPRLQRTTMSQVVMEDRPNGFAIVATWPATKGSAAGRWEREYTTGNIKLAMREVRCKTRRGIAGAILQARGL